MSTHNIGFYEEISKIIIKYRQIRTLFLLQPYSLDSEINWIDFLKQSLWNRSSHKTYNLILSLVCHLCKNNYTDTSNSDDVLGQFDISPASIWLLKKMRYRATHNNQITFSMLTSSTVLFADG